MANIFFRIGYIEAWGRGILLMTEEMKNAGMQEPIIEEFAGGMQITFFKGLIEDNGFDQDKTLRTYPF